MNTRAKTRNLTQFSILLAIEAIFCFTPLGSIPVGPIVMTLAMVPVILCAILMGAKAGSLMGFFAGLFSFIIWTFMPPPTSAMFAFVFTPFYSVGGVQGNFGSLLICFVPRILVGTVAGLTFSLTKGLDQKAGWLRYILSGLLGSLVNTIGVLGGIWLFFGERYSAMLGVAMSVILATTLTTNGLLEMAVSALSALFICMPIKKAMDKSK